MTRIASSNRTRFRPQAEPSETDLAAVRQAVLNQATIAAFGASTLEEAQAILGAANPALTTNISFDAAFLGVTSATPALSATRTCTVPTGNPGIILMTATASVRCSVAGGAFSSSVIGAGITVADTDSLQFERVALGPAIISLFDSTTGAQINPDFTLRAT